MKTATYSFLVAVLIVTTACNRESSRSRRAAKAAASVHTVELTDTSFDREVVEKFQPTLVEFWHDSSEDCLAMAPVLEEIAVEFEGRLKVAKAHVSRCPKLADFYGIRGSALPVMILFVGNTEIDRIIGPKTKEELAAKLNNAKRGGYLVVPPKK
jgi:thioredoxin 1